MANKETPKVPINRDRFFEVLKARGSSIRKLGEAYNEIQRTEKTIRICLDAARSFGADCQVSECPPRLSGWYL